MPASLPRNHRRVLAWRCLIYLHFCIGPLHCPLSRMAAHRKSDQHRVYLCAGGLRKRGSSILTCRGRLRRALHVRVTREKFRHLGCSPKVLQDWIERQFQPEMTWENYGLWEVDHIRPCSSFDMGIKSERIACFHYTNLQPLWRRANREKSKWIPPQGVRVRPSLYL
jgi:hypothetical protein